MQKSKIISQNWTKVLGAFTIALGVFLFVGACSAATADILQPASAVEYTEPVQIHNTLKVDQPGYFPQGVHIGSTEAGVGGVTYFNGTIVNASVNEDGEDVVPVTFGDNVRIDGTIFRGGTEGPGDDMPLKLNDDVTVYGDLEVKGELNVGSLTDKNGAGLPIAYGTCNDDGTKFGGTANFTCSWDEGDDWYEITIEDENYYYSDYVTVVTPFDDDLIPVVNSINDKLLVILQKREGATDYVQGAFGFVTYKNP